MDMRHPSGFDRTRNTEIGRKNFELEYLEEAFTSLHWLVRIYRVKPPINALQLSKTRRRIRKFNSVKTTSNLRGQLNLNAVIA